MRDNAMETYTSEEIYQMFRESDLKSEFKNIILARFDALCQGMYNAVNNPETTMKMRDTHGDFWQEEHNRLVTEYQKTTN